jgi:phospholipid transport system substrate-binding protein
MSVRRTLIFLLAGFCGHAWAQTPGATKPVDALDHGLTELLATGPAIPFERRYNQLAPVVDHAFDLSTILQAVVGPKWAGLPPDQRQSLLTAFRSYTIANYVANFSNGKGTVVKTVAGVQPVGDGQMVPTLIQPASGEATKVNYLVKNGKGEWQITDIYLDGTISQVAVQRSDFRGLLASGDGAKPLIQQLNKKVSDLSGGAMKP